MRGLYDEPICKHILVAVERGVDRYPDGLTYGVPQSLLRVGVAHRVKVPLGLGDSSTFGWVVKEIPPEQAASIAPERMKSILSIEDTDPLPAQIVELARWMSVYYCCPLGVALAGASVDGEAGPLESPRGAPVAICARRFVQASDSPTSQTDSASCHETPPLPRTLAFA